MIQGAQDSFCRYLMLQKLQLEAYSNELFFPSDSLSGMDFLLHTKVSTVETPVSNIWWTQNVRPGWLLTKDGHFGEFRPYNCIGSKFCLFLIGNCRDFIHVKSQFWEKNLVISMKKFSSLALPRSAIMLQHLTIQFLCCFLSIGRLQEVKNGKENIFKRLSLKVVAVAYKSCSLTRDSKHSGLT